VYGMYLRRFVKVLGRKHVQSTKNIYCDVEMLLEGLCLDRHESHDGPAPMFKL
jgi:precorrin isomerase